MKRHDTLVIAIDETGRFLEQKLKGRRRASSGIAAVLTTWSDRRLTDHLKSLGQDLGLRYPDQFHIMEILDPERRADKNLWCSDEKASALVSELRGRTAHVLDGKIGVYGKLPRRRFFHEQQAYGEMLLALLHSIREQFAPFIKAAPAIEIRIATRMKKKLTGYTDPDRYHDELCAFLQHWLEQEGWPRDKTKVLALVGTRDPYLILADFAATELADRPAWATAAHDLHLPASFREAVGAAQRLDRTAALILRVMGGDKVDVKQLAEDTQANHETLRRLTAAAHACVSDRHGEGSLVRGERLLELAWSVADRAGGGAVSLMGELCTIAAEICSHRGLAEDDPVVLTWADRASALPGRAWAADALSARAARIDFRCQTVQTDAFNRFAFEDVYFEFLEELEHYERDADRALLEEDEIYGKLLGTLGQACGFLRPQQPATGEEAWSFLTRSQPCFAGSAPLFRAMNLGYRLTDLWDRGELEEASKLMTDESLPKAAQADAYALLHRLRLAAGLRDRGLEHEALGPLINRLLAHTANAESRGATPWDLALKWALFLCPDDSRLTAAAKQWAERLESRQIAILATSLPLLVQLGLRDRAREHLSRLRQLPGFESHWQTERAAPLAAALESGERPGYEALRGMPWNYA